MAKKIMAKKLSIALAVGSLGLFSAGVGATALSFESPGSSIYQQTLNSPCVIGENSCNNPAGFGFTLIPVQTNPNTLSSPTYTVGQISAIVGSSFFVGVDINQATQNVPPYTLINGASGFAFTLNINGGAPEFTLNCGAGGCVSTLVNNGNGFSDALIKGFDLSTFLATDTAVFTVTYTNDTDGREQFFIVSSGTVPCTPITCPQIVAEPGTLALLGMALLTGVVGIRRRLQNGAAAS